MSSVRLTTSKREQIINTESKNKFYDKLEKLNKDLYDLINKEMAKTRPKWVTDEILNSAYLETTVHYRVENIDHECTPEIKRIINNIWIPIDDKDLKDFEWGLVNFSEKLKEIGFVGEQLYKHHKILFELDAITILYVAMTRAKKELHILSMKTNQINSLSYSGLFLSYCENLKSNHKGEFEWGKNEINKDFKEDFTQNFSLDINSNLNWKNIDRKFEIQVYWFELMNCCLG